MKNGRKKRKQRYKRESALGNRPRDAVGVDKEIDTMRKEVEEEGEAEEKKAESRRGGERQGGEGGGEEGGVEQRNHYARSGKQMKDCSSTR